MGTLEKNERLKRGLDGGLGHLGLDRRLDQGASPVVTFDVYTRRLGECHGGICQSEMVAYEVMTDL